MLGVCEVCIRHWTYQRYDAIQTHPRGGLCVHRGGHSALDIIIIIIIIIIIGCREMGLTA